MKASSLNPNHTNIIEGISIFTCCMNRNNNLDRSLKTWIEIPAVNEILIVDWSSNDLVFELVKKYHSKKIIVARVEDQKHWILSYAFNLAARLTTRTKLLKLDADVQVSQDFFQCHPLKPGTFFAGNWRTAKTQNDRHLNGIIYIYRDDFFKVNGYNENITTYGWDDSDLYQRLVASGIQRYDFILDKLYHQEHEERMKYQSSDFGSAYIESEALLNFEIQKNMYICNSLPAWNTETDMVEFKVIPTALENLIYCLPTYSFDSSKFLLPKCLTEQAKINALQEVLSWEISKDLLKTLGENDLIKLFKVFFSFKENVLDRDSNLAQKWNIITHCNTSDPKIVISQLESINHCYNNLLVDEIHVFYLPPDNDALKNFIYKYFKNKHIRVNFVQTMPTYNTLIDYANDNFSRGRKVACFLSSFCFDKALTNLEYFNLKDSLFFLTSLDINSKQEYKDLISSSIFLFEASLWPSQIFKAFMNFFKGNFKVNNNTRKNTKIIEANVFAENKDCYCMDSFYSEELGCYVSSLESINSNSMSLNNSCINLNGYKLIISLYNELESDRIQEYITCLDINLAHILIDEIHIFYDTLKDKVGHEKSILTYLIRMRNIKYGIKKKVFIHHIEGRPTYRQLFEYSNKNFPISSRVIIANADIYFNKTLELLQDIDIQDKFLVLSRWDVLSDGSLKLSYQDNGLPNYLTADTWIFESPININFYCEYPIGTWFCDSFLNTQLIASSNLQIYNPCLDIQACHLHRARRNTEEYQERINNRLAYWQIEWKRNNQQDPNSGIVWCDLSQFKQGSLPRFVWKPRNLILKLINSNLDRINKMRIIISGMILADRTSSNFWLADLRLTDCEKMFLSSFDDLKYNLTFNYLSSSASLVLSNLSSIQDNLFESSSNICIEVLDYDSNDLVCQNYLTMKLSQYGEYVSKYEKSKQLDFEAIVRVAYCYYYEENYLQMKINLEKSTMFTDLSSIRLILQWVDLFSEFSYQFDHAFNVSLLTSLPEWNQLIHLFLLRSHRPSKILRS